MKRTFCVWLVLVSTVLAGVALAKEPFVMEEVYDPSFIRQILPNGITVALSGVPKEQIPLYKEQITRAYNTWFKETAQFIKQQNRQEEFGALYIRLAQGINVRFSTNNPDVKIGIVRKNQLNEVCGADADANLLGCASVKKRPFAVYLPSRKELGPQVWYSTLLHELGHTLGLDEQYDDLYSHNDGISRIYSSSTRDPDSAMNEYTDIFFPSADDADGIINVIDRYAGNLYGHENKKWNSLREGSPDSYKNGKREGAEKQAHIIHDYASREWKVQRPGKRTETYMVPDGTHFKSVQDFLNIEADNLTWHYKQPVKVIEPGHWIISSDFQGQTNRLFFKGKTLVAADSLTRREGQTDYVAHISVNGKVAYLAWMQAANSSSKTIVYAKDITRHKEVKKFSCPANVGLPACLSTQVVSSSLTKQVKKDLGKRK